MYNQERELFSKNQRVDGGVKEVATGFGAFGLDLDADFDMGLDMDMDVGVDVDEH